VGRGGPMFEKLERFLSVGGPEALDDSVDGDGRGGVADLELAVVLEVVVPEWSR